jgi:hypothetical protein
LRVERAETADSADSVTRAISTASLMLHLATSNLTGYHQRHLVTYLRLLDANADGADCKKWQKSSCTSTQNANRIGQSVRGKAV